MEGFVDTDGGFSGNKRQNTISELLFGMLCGDTTTDVFEWLEYTIGWESSFSSEEETLFASLARALPRADFRFTIDCYYYDYEGWQHHVEYLNGKLIAKSEKTHLVTENDENYIDGEILTSFECTIDKEGNFIGNSRYMLQACIELEKENMSDLLNLIETGTDDPGEMVKLGILFETGLAELDKNLEKAWNYYLKAAETGNEKAVKIVREIFSDECREDLLELLTNKDISKESFPLFFELASKENNAELTAQLLEYNKNLD